MADVEVELLRRRQNGTVAAWLLDDDGKEPVRDAEALVKLEALRALLDGTLDVFLTNLPAVQAVSGTVTVANPGLTDTQLRATPLPVSGTVTALPSGTQAVSGTVTVSNPGLTDSQLRAAAVPVSTGLAPLTDNQLRATPVPVSGTVTALPTGTQAVSGTVAVSSVAGMVEVQNDSGNPLAVSGSVTVGNTTAAPVPVTVTNPTAPATTVVANQGLAGLAAWPVTGPLTDTQLRATPVPVSGTVTATPTGTQAVSGSVDVTDRAARLVGVVTGPLTDTQLRATPVPVSGTVTTSPSGTQAVSGPLTDTQLRAAAVPVSTGLAPLTDTQLRAAAVPVSGPLTDAQARATPLAVSGPLTDAQLRAAGVPVLGPLTDAQLRATALPVSLAATVGLTDTQLRASALTVTPREQRVTGNLTAVAAATTTGTTSTAGTIVVPAEGSSGFSAQVIHSALGFVGSVITEYSLDNGATWTPTAWRQTINGGSRNTYTAATDAETLGTYTGGLLRGSSAGATHYRIRLVTLTSGSATVNLVAHLGTGPVFSNTVLDTRTVFQYLCSKPGGRVGFNATIDVVTSSATEQLLAAFRNPAGSGVDLTIYRLEFGASVAGKVRRYRGGTLTPGTGQNPSTAVNRGGGTNTTVGQLYPGTRGLAGLLGTTATGGTLAKVTYMVGGVDDSDTVDGTITLRPGELSYFTVTNNSGAGDAALEVVWAQTAAAV